MNRKAEEFLPQGQFGFKKKQNNAGGDINTETDYRKGSGKRQNSIYIGFADPEKAVGNVN